MQVQKKEVYKPHVHIIPASLAQHSQISHQQALFFKFQLGNTLFSALLLTIVMTLYIIEFAECVCREDGKGEKAQQVETVGKLCTHIFVNIKLHLVNYIVQYA